MRTLVTGATGLLGNNVVRILLSQGHDVRVLIRAPDIPRPLADLDVEMVRGDVSDAKSIDAAVQGVDNVVHSAGFVKIGWSGLEEARKVNVEGTRLICDAALRHQARLVHVSTVNTLGLGRPGAPANEDSPPTEQVPCAYVVSKREAEQAVLSAVDQGLHGAIVNPGFMLGPWDWKPSSGRMLIEVATRFTPAAPPGGCSVVHVRDVAAGILSTLEKGQPGRRYILAGENMSYLELWKAMAHVAGSRGPRWRLGIVIRFLSGHCGDVVYRLTGREPLINSAAVRMSAQHHYYSSQRAVDELGYEVHPAEEAIRDAYDWFKAHDYL